METYKTNWISIVCQKINEVEKIAVKISETKYAVALFCGTVVLHLCMKLADETLYGKPLAGVGALNNKRVFGNGHDVQCYAKSCCI